MGQVLDAVAAFAPMIVLAIVTAPMADSSETLAGMLWLPALLFCLVYLFFSDALPEGQSLGKRIMGIAVVDRRTGRPCTAWQAFVRNVLLAILGFFDWIFIFGERHQRLGDMVAGTIVVEAASVGVPQVQYQ
jgi:uncharacterized RDD family membrane protein YckC